MKEFEEWRKNSKFAKEPYCILTGDPVAGGVLTVIPSKDIEDIWRAALELVLKLCPTNEKATFANQGQGMDGYTELANYKAMYKKLKEELNNE